MPKVDEEGQTERESSLIWRGKPTLEAFYPFYLVGALSAGTGTTAELAFALPLWTLGILVPFVALMIASPLAFQAAWSFTVTETEVRRDFRLFIGRSKSAPIDKVTDVTARQGAIGRLFGFGTVRVDTAGTPFPGVEIWGVGDPFAIERAIRGVVEEHAGEED